MDEREARIQKLRDLQTAGRDPFAVRTFHASHRVEEIARLVSFVEEDDTGVWSEFSVSVVGRVMAVRDQGKSLWLRLRGEDGDVQVWARADETAEYDVLKRSLDMGDIVGFAGYPFRTQRGEATVVAMSHTMVAKCLQPMPKDTFGLNDVETRRRKRHLDLIYNEDARRVLVSRSKIVSALRRHLDGCGFIEVETPILQPVYGGASADPFVTHYNALDEDYYLRIAPELYLKRLLVGGIEGVYEVGRQFRNEGMDSHHNPEFTSVEVYLAYADLNDMMQVARGCVISMAASLGLIAEGVDYRGQHIEFRERWPVVDLSEAVGEEAALIDPLADWDVLKITLKLEATDPVGALLEAFEKHVQPKLIQPTFVVGFPTEVSPLAKASADDPAVADRFELYIGGEEVGNAFAELNDPLEQRHRLELQARVNGEPLDEDFLDALECGMPPAGGLGLGVDRLVMVLTGCESIRDVLPFPQLKRSQR